MRLPIQTLTEDERIEKTTFAVAPIDDVAETIREDALASARQKHQAEDAGLTMLFGRRDFLDSFKYEVACRAADVLAAVDRNVQAVYVYDADLNPDAEISAEVPLDVTIRLLLHVSAPTAALQVFIAALDRALVSSLKELPSALFQQRDFILEVNLIADQDIQHRLGYAKLLSSVFAPPLKVWQREE